jgi:DNA replication and repair protein RecF
VQLDNNGLQTRFNLQTEKKRAQFAYALPIQFIHPKSYKLLDAGPQLRREYIDWGLFNTDKDYLLQWQRFKKALSQRNALLKRRRVDEIAVWDKELVKYGTILSAYRSSYLEQLKPLFFEVANQFISVDNLEINYYVGWDDASEFDLALSKVLDKDLRYGYTTLGPHHSDFKLMINGKLAKEYVSRGQLKLLVLALKLAQVKHLQSLKNQYACILIDDLASELDKKNRNKLLDFLDETGMQVFITATEREHFGDISKYSLSAMFHVEQGCINKM